VQDEGGRLSREPAPHLTRRGPAPQVAALVGAALAQRAEALLPAAGSGDAGAGAARAGTELARAAARAVALLAPSVPPAQWQRAARGALLPAAHRFIELGAAHGAPTLLQASHDFARAAFLASEAAGRDLPLALLYAGVWERHGEWLRGGACQPGCPEAGPTMRHPTCP